MKTFNFILALILTTQTAFAGVITDDKLELGKPSSAATKQLIFKGPTKKTLSSTAAGALGYDGNSMLIGDGANSADKTITFNKGVNSPSIKYNFATGTIQFSNDNVNFLDMGSGSGGAGGIQMLSDPEFEKATISTFWTPSAGTLTALTSGGNFSGFDKQSASWVPTAAATLSSETITIVNGLLGARGSASIFYKTASALHKLQVYDGTTVIAEKLLPVSSGFRKEEFSFAIPVSGTVQLRLLAGDTTAIYADKAFLGVPSSSPADEDFVVVKNIFPNPKAEGTSPSWLAYKDAAGTAPVDGVSGSPTLSCTLSSSSPLEGTRSFLITKPASNVQGEGCAHNLKPLEETDKAKLLQVSFDYKVASGTYTDDTLKLYVYDIDNAQMIELAPTFVKNSTLAETFKAVFQTTLTGVNYRLIWHYAATDAVATSLKIDNLRVSSQILASGNFTTDWVAYTGSCSGSWTSNTTYACQMRYVGDSAEFQIRVTTSAAPTATSLIVNLPVTIDSAKMPSPNSYTNLGSASLQSAGTSYGAALVGFQSTTSVSVWAVRSGSGNAHDYTPVNATTPATFGGGDFAYLTFKVPVVGRSSNTVLSSEYSSRNVNVRYTGTSSVTPTSLTPAIFKMNTAVIDSHGAYNTSTGLFTAPISATYSVTCATHVGSTAGAVTNAFDIAIQKNAVTVANRYVTAYTTSAVEHSPTITALVPMTAGDTLGCYIGQNLSGSALSLTNSTRTYIDVKIDTGGGPAVAQDVSVSARYSITSAPSIPNNGGIVVFTIPEYDSHSAYNTSTGLFTCPVSGKYLITGAFTFGSSATGRRGIFFFKNGSTKSLGATNFVNGVTSPVANGSTIEQCLTGETFSIIAFQDSGGALALTNGTSENWFAIQRLGN